MPATLTVPYQETISTDNLFQYLVKLLKGKQNGFLPDLILGYSDAVDTSGHRFGPNSEETQEAVRSFDKNLGKFLNFLDGIKFPISLIIASDHGMIEVGDSIDIKDIFCERHLQMIDFQGFGGPTAFFNFRNATTSGSFIK